MTRRFDRPLAGCSVSMSLEPAPTPADGDAMLAVLRSTVDPETGRALENANSRASTAYVCAALAVRRSHPSAQKNNGEPNYAGAARMYLDSTNINSNTGTLVKLWVAKLDKLDRIRSQASLAAELEELDLPPNIPLTTELPELATNDQAPVEI